MGEIFKSVMLSYAVCAFCGGILQYLCLSESAEKTFRFAVAAAAVSVAVIPLVTSTGSELAPPQVNIAESGEYSETDALMHLANAVEKNIYGHISETLINLGVREYEIYVETKTDEAENTVSVTLVRVEVDAEYKSLLPEIEEILKAEYGEVLETDVKTQQS